MHKKIIITGHSSGLGKALAEHYLQNGIPVFGIARRSLPDTPKLQQAALDLSDGAAVETWLEGGCLAGFIKEADEVVLLNNAATVAPSALCGRQRPSEIAAAVALNIAAPMLFANYILAAKTEKQRVKIVHISSGAARKAYPGWSVYGACKAALDHHLRCVEAENHANVSVCSIAPGVVDTAMQAEIRNLPPEDFPILPRFRQLHEQQELSTPESAAKIIAAMIEDEDFGVEIIQDVRTWQTLKETFQTALR